MNRYKYKNKIVSADGIKFDSKLEYNIYTEMVFNELKFELQPKYLLQESFKLNGKTYRAIHYIADFKLFIDDNEYIIDAKGMETPVFKIKEKMFAKKYQKEIIKIKSLKHFKEWVKGVKK